ncbi:pentapeptide repeat-containing protein [Brevundimonas sp.]|uniref:pentapeptide repeat-containing protein n=1 Tax=Brevundimonas sp. TaxID=1871086 RepID=UPI0025B95714|nr:pentapeptide repeat-containing protein [Brevundimonas sp.]
MARTEKAGQAAMIPFEVKNRWTGEVQFTAQISCSPDATPAVKLGLAVRWAVKEKANLDGASLYGASLDGANLNRANLDGANLYGASLDGASLYGASLLALGDMRFVKTLQLERWMVGYSADTMQIGCQRHAIADWWTFTDEQIAEMDSAALEWWGRWKPVIQQIVAMNPAEATGYVESATNGADQ